MVIVYGNLKITGTTEFDDNVTLKPSSNKIFNIARNQQNCIAVNSDADVSILTTLNVGEPIERNAYDNDVQLSVNSNTFQNDDILHVVDPNGDKCLIIDNNGNMNVDNSITTSNITSTAALFGSLTITKQVDDVQLLVKAGYNQLDDIVRVCDNNGTDFLNMSSTGKLTLSTPNVLLSDNILEIYGRNGDNAVNIDSYGINSRMVHIHNIGNTSFRDNVQLSIQANNGQTSNIMDILNHNGDDLLNISSSGKFTLTTTDTDLSNNIFEINDNNGDNVVHVNSCGINSIMVHIGSTSSTDDIQLSIQANAGQVHDIVSISDSSGNDFLNISSSGKLTLSTPDAALSDNILEIYGTNGDNAVNIDSTGISSRMVHIHNIGSTPFHDNVQLTIQANDGQTSNMMEIKNHSGTTMLYMDNQADIVSSKSIRHLYNIIPVTTEDLDSNSIYTFSSIQSGSIAFIDGFTNDSLTIQLPNAVKGAKITLLFGDNSGNLPFTIFGSGTYNISGLLNNGYVTSTSFTWPANGGAGPGGLGDVFYFGETVDFICVADGQWVCTPCAHFDPYEA